MADLDRDDEGRHRRWPGIVAILVLVLAALALAGWVLLLREVPQKPFASMDQQFFYGSIGAENDQGLPYWVWFVLPKMFPEYLPGPGGYAALGIPWERAHEVPVGFSRKTIGFDRVAINCAFCHAGSYRLSPTDTDHILAGAPNHTFDPLAYERFLFACANDPRFNSKNILDAIANVYDMPLHERLLYSWILIPQTRSALLKQKKEFHWTTTRPPWGHGRIDPFNPVKVAILNLDAGDTIGNADMEPIWGLQGTKNEVYHWDGLNTDLLEVYRSSALGDGATKKSIPLDTLDRLREWMATVKPAAYPYPVNQALAAQGAAIFQQQHCNACHGDAGSGLGVIVPIDEIGTDRHRFDMWTAQAAKNYNAYMKGAWTFSHFRKTDGYNAPNLRGLWLRGPYLHNGSVPNLRALLMPPAQRPRQFWRGCDVFDAANVGFVSDAPMFNGVRLTNVDVSVAGNGNGGHVYGTTLDDASKGALMEYLKTL